jgi:predicted DNA-binding transcriptional regulator YafY
MKHFMQELECTRNTITRDFAFMRDYLRAPIEYVKDANGHVYDPGQPVFELPGFWMNASELHALLVCEQLLEDAQPGLMATRLAPLKQRIRDLLKQSGGEPDSMEHKLRIQPLYSRRVDDRIFMQAAEATLQGRQITFTYHARSRDETRERHVSPQQLVHYRHSWYLLGWCHAAQDLRLFALDKITAPAVQESAAKQLPQDDIKRFTESSFGIFYGAARATAHLVFSASSARWAADEAWHPDQQGWWEDDHYHLQLPYANSTELVMEILRHGDGVEVLSPPQLRDEIRAKVAGLQKIYCTQDQ